MSLNEQFSFVNLIVNVPSLYYLIGRLVICGGLMLHKNLSHGLTSG